MFAVVDFRFDHRAEEVVSSVRFEINDSGQRRYRTQLITSNGRLSVTGLPVPLV